MLAKRGHFAVLVAVIVDQLRCNRTKVYVFRPEDLGIALALVLVSTQLVPFHTPALASGAVVEAGTSALFFLTKRTVPGILAAALALLSVLWSIGVWFPVWFPDLFAPNLSLPISFGMPVFKIGSLTFEAGPGSSRCCCCPPAA